MKKWQHTAILAAAVTMMINASQVEARNQIRIVGSSTVYPFATVVAENFARSSSFKGPVIESTGTGGGIKLFCAGVGGSHPDIANASRAIKSSEARMCADNGVDFAEVHIGFDGIVIGSARSAAPLNLTRHDLYLALAAKVPDANGQLIDNPYVRWNQVNPSLPASTIRVIGPPPTSGTRDAFLELVMEKGAETFESVASLDKEAFKKASHTLREDGHFIEAGENDNLIVQKLDADAALLGIFGFSFLEQNADKIQGASIEGVIPSFEAILNNQYKISRPLFFYVKRAHVGVIPGLKEYVQEFTSDRAVGEDGYLLDFSLIPVGEEDRGQLRQMAADL